MSAKFFTSAALFAATALAAPQGTPYEPYYFTASVGINNGSVLYSAPLNPNDGTIWAGKPVNISCPQGQPYGAPACPAGNDKGVYYLKGDSLYLGTAQAVTQQVYVDSSDGVLHFNDVDQEIPEDVYTGGWTRDPDSGALTYGTWPIWACQVGEPADNTYDIVVGFDNVDVHPYFCGGTPTGIATQAASGTGAFEYN